MKIHLFYKPGELEFKLQAQQQGHKLEYVGDEPEFWRRDIDFIINDRTAVEVKWDSWINTTGNLFIETANPRSKDGKGWYLFCEADYLAYGDSRINQFYIIKMSDLRHYISTHNLELKITNDGAEGFLVSLNDISDIYAIL